MKKEEGFLMTEHGESGAAVNAAYTMSDHEARARDVYAHAKYALTLRWLQGFIKPGMLAYNIGCGGGYFNSVLRRQGLEVAACEPDQRAFDLALHDRDEGTLLIQGDLSVFRQTVERQADVIVMHDVLEHIEDDADAARMLCSLLRPGGRAIVSVPAMQSLFGRHDVELGHYRRYTKSTLKKVLAPHFKLLRLRYYGMASIPIVLVFSKILRRPYPMATAQKGLIHKVYGAVCHAETYVSEPVGTAVMCELSIAD